MLLVLGLAALNSGRGAAFASHAERRVVMLGMVFGLVISALKPCAAGRSLACRAGVSRRPPWLLLTDFCFAESLAMRGAEPSCVRGIRNPLSDTTTAPRRAGTFQRP